MWCTVPVSAPSGHPRWFTVVLGVGIALLLAAVALFVLAAVGVDQVGSLGSFVVVLLAALAAGYLVRIIEPKLPPLGRDRR